MSEDSTGLEDAATDAVVISGVMVAIIVVGVAIYLMLNIWGSVMTARLSGNSNRGVYAGSIVANVIGWVGFPLASIASIVLGYVYK
jgi:hypothetical protein